MAISLEVMESMRKHDTGSSVARENVERGTEGGMPRENMELQKLTMILVLYDAIVLKSMSKLTFKSTQETVLY